MACPLITGLASRVIFFFENSPCLICRLPSLKGNVKFEGGQMKQMSHWSEANQCEMTFSVFLPDRKERKSPDPPGRVTDFFGIFQSALCRVCDKEIDLREHCHPVVDHT